MSTKKENSLYNRKRSDIWLYFTPILNEEKAICQECKLIFSFKNSSTGNLWKHLEAKHQILRCDVDNTTFIEKREEILKSTSPVPIKEVEPPILRSNNNKKTQLKAKVKTNSNLPWSLIENKVLQVPNVVKFILEKSGFNNILSLMHMTREDLKEIENFAKQYITKDDKQINLLPGHKKFILNLSTYISYKGLDYFIQKSSSTKKNSNNNNDYCLPQETVIVQSNSYESYENEMNNFTNDNDMNGDNLDTTTVEKSFEDDYFVDTSKSIIVKEEFKNDDINDFNGLEMDDGDDDYKMDEDNDDDDDDDDDDDEEDDDYIYKIKETKRSKKIIPKTLHSVKFKEQLQQIINQYLEKSYKSCDPIRNEDIQLYVTKGLIFGIVSCVLCDTKLRVVTQKLKSGKQRWIASNFYKHMGKIHGNLKEVLPSIETLSET